MSIYIDGRDCCQTGQFSQDVADGALTLAEAFEHYNEWHPHSALGYRSPREYLRQQASNGLSDNRCLEI
ncbi:hypothetical protein CCZ08_24765 [Escherichia coli]|nr:hypothetical protein CCZ11_24735 [Escherichia coli]RAY02647.1 hypothetical protein CCZ08_24765 [Escherichia coli]